MDQPMGLFSGVFSPLDGETPEGWLKRRVRESREWERERQEEAQRAQEASWKLWDIREGLLFLAADDITAVMKGKTYSSKTLANHAEDFARFKDWCDQEGVPALPAHEIAIAGFIVAGHYSPLTVRRIIGSIAAEHRKAGIADPTCSPLIDAAKRFHKRTWAQGKAKYKATIDAIMQSVE